MDYRLLLYGAPWCNQCIVQNKEIKNNIVDCIIHEINIDDIPDSEVESLCINKVPYTLLLYYDDTQAKWVELKTWEGYIDSNTIIQTLHTNQLNNTTIQQYN